MERDNGWESGAEGLWLAVVVQAVEDLHGHRSPAGSLRGRLSIRSAQEWVQSSDGGIGSLAWICNILGLEVEWVRRLALGAVPLRNANFLGKTGNTCRFL